MKIPFLHKAPQEKPPATLATEFQSFVHKNAPSDFQTKLSYARPYIFASFIAWPMFWLYRGIEWTRNRNADKLAFYIHRTFLQAKMMQIGIITMGIVAATYDPKPLVRNVNNFFRGYNYPGSDLDDYDRGKQE